MSARDAVLGRIRTALGRQSGGPPAGVPPVRLRAGVNSSEMAVQFAALLDSLGVKPFLAETRGAALVYVKERLQDKNAVASNSPVLQSCGITALATVRSGVNDKAELRSLCAIADIGITGADFALADTGTLVMLSSREEARMISLLPPVHIAVVAASRLLPSLDDLLLRDSLPAEMTSAMVLITGTSRTADIEQILVRGVHGPGEVHVIILVNA